MKPATTVTKVCRVLNEFRNRPSMGVTELARRTDLLPSDVHRILASLLTCGFVEQNADTKTYRIGTGLFKLGLSVLQRSEICERARPLLKKLSELTEATAHMAIFDRRELDIFLAEQVDFPREIPFKSSLGSPTNPTRTALGKTIMANVDGPTLSRLLEKSGVVSPHAEGCGPLREELRRIRLQGYGLDLEECVRGACCLGAPVRDFTGSTVGAISISMNAQRFYRCFEPDLALEVKASAAELSVALGYEPAGAQLL